MQQNPTPSRNAPWESSWLAWLEDVQTRSGISYFGDYPAGEDRFDHLMEMFLADKTAVQGASWLESDMKGSA